MGQRFSSTYKGDEHSISSEEVIVQALTKLLFYEGENESELFGKRIQNRELVAERRSWG